MDKSMLEIFSFRVNRLKKIFIQENMFAALGNNFSALSEINSFKPTDAQK